MDSNLPKNDDEQFSEDPRENIEMENQFLKMKLMAETGARFMEGDGQLPPEMLNEWLKNIAEFEENFATAEEKPLREWLDNPVFLAADDLDDATFNQENERLQKLLADHQIDVGFGRERDDRFQYEFITGELMDHRTTLYPGMITGFLYEEFHPDHELDIIEKTHEFLNAFFDCTLSGNPFLFSDAFIQPDGKILSLEELDSEIKDFYHLVDGFENVSFQIEKTDFTLRNEMRNERETEVGEGYSEGEVKYEIVLRNGERKQIHGPFKIYFMMDVSYLSIFFFYLSGYNLFSK